MGKTGQRVRRIGRRAALTGGAAVVGSVVAAGATARAALAAPGHEIVGSWLLAVSGPARMTLQTYMADGGLTTTQSEYPNRGPGHGAWVRTA